MMKFVRIGLVTVFALLVGAYIYVLGPTPKQSNASEQTWASTDSKGQIAVSLDADNYNAGTYTARFHLRNQTGNTITVNVKWLTNFCTGGHVNSCLDNQHVVSQGPFVLPAGGTADPSISTSTQVNFTPANIACGTFQDDFFFTTSNGGTYGTTNLSTTLAAGWFDTNITCQPKSNPTPTPTQAPTPTPTAFPTSTPTPTPITATPTMPTATPTPTSPTETPTVTPTPTTTTEQQCPAGFDVEVINSIVFCQQQTQTQTQTSTNNNDNSSNNSSTNNNNNDININLASYAPQQQQQQQQVQVQPAPQTTSLPSTGTPLTDVLSIISMVPAGFIIRKFTNRG